MHLSSCYLFKELSDSQLDRLGAITREVRFDKGQWLFEEGREADGLYVLKEGAIELMSQVEENFVLPIKVLRDPGSCFGTSALIAPYTYSLSARCAADCRLLTVDLARLRDLMNEDLQLGCTVVTNLAQYLRSRLRETREELKVHFKIILKVAH